MGADLSEGAKIAITLIILGVLMSIVFTILSFTRSATNQGISSVGANMDAMQLSKFDDYDQMIKSGTEVKSALKLFEGQPIAIVVRTLSQMSASAKSGHNYGALLTGTNTTTFVTPSMDLASGKSWFEINLSSSGTGIMTYNMNYIPTTTSGTSPYIRPTAKFLAQLIKDTTGTIVGICFTQQ